MAEDVPPPLSLKVMRVSRPQLAAAWHPFYSSSPAFSAHSTASVTSLQGKTPLPGHPKTLRDLTNPIDLLTLPSSFGTIQLGESFSSCLCINNEATVEVDAVHLRVDIQTANSKVLLAEFGGPHQKIQPRDTMECLVTHEIKELGQHVLACAVTYRSPPGLHLPATARDTNEHSSLQTFRKFYKFSVSNPLSVKTKIHVSPSPSALLSPTERDKVFLEVHIQNITHELLNFEKMHFETADGWTVDDANTLPSSQSQPQPLFSGAMALMQPQDTRQYIYILTPTAPSLVPPTYPPGSVIPLGRLDISWRSSVGEPGRLLTSMLSRRIPLLSPPPQTPVSAVPPYLKRTIAQAPSRPQSPLLSQSRPGSPAGSAQSPFQAIAPPLPVPDIVVHLLYADTPAQRTIRVDEPFTLSFTLVVSSPIAADRPHHHRTVTLAIQHLELPRIDAPSFSPLPTHVQPQPTVRDGGTGAGTTSSGSGFSTPSVLNTHTFNYPLAHQKILVAASTSVQVQQSQPATAERTGTNNSIIIPAPYFDGPNELNSYSSNVMFIGSSVQILPPVELSIESSEKEPLTATAVQKFGLSYLPFRKGFTTVGGLRILLVNDSFVSDSVQSMILQPQPRKARTLKEWDVISEVWVEP